MEQNLSTRLKNAWNTFLNKNPVQINNDYSYASFYRPDRAILSRGNDRSIVTSVLNRIALDVSGIDLKHCKVDEDGRYNKIVKSGLNNCLTLESNIDQTSRSFIQDVVLTMLDEGTVAVVPVDTSTNPYKNDSYDILTLRAGKIVEWYPYNVKVRLYNDRTGKKEDIVLPKDKICIIENPLYSVMNQPNSTLQRLCRKLVLIDSVDEQTSSGKLDLIIQLPYIIKSDARKAQANQRREEIERQLAGSKYGIAYTDGTEKITQLNRSLENNLMKQIEYLTNMLYSQLGITSEILNGTANETVMLNYYSRTIEPIVAAIANEMTRKFLSKKSKSNKEKIMYFRDPFKLVPVKELAELADKFTRNEIMSSNEIRSIIGLKPSEDPRANELINSNLNHPDEQYQYQTEETSQEEIPKEENYNENDITDENYINDVINTLNDDQAAVVKYLLDMAVNNKKGG